MRNTLDIRYLMLIMVSLSITVFLACGDETTGPEAGPDDWQWYEVDDFRFDWLVEDSLSSLRIKITAPTTGWIAVGFDPISFMEEANLLIGYVSGGTVHIRDDYGITIHTHDADTNLGGTDDVTMITGSESSGETMIEFRIPLDSGDQYDKVITEGTTYLIIFAYGANGSDDYTSQHAWAETVSLEI